MTIRGILTWAMGVLVAVTLAAAASLIALTTALNRNTETLVAALQSVRLAEEMELNLVSYTRSADEIGRSSIRADIRDSMRRAEQYVGSSAEHQILSGTEQALLEYFARDAVFFPKKGASLDQGPELERAFGSIGALARVNVEQADDARETARRWDRLGDVLGISVTVVLVLGMAIVSAGVSGFVTRPIIMIRDAMRQLPGESVRIPEVGPRELREIARELNHAAEALGRQRSERLVFLASVAHDLRNPLTALRMAGGLVNEARPSPSEDRLRRTITIMNRQVDRLDRMVGDFLDAARIETGQLELRFERCDARMLVREVIELFGSSTTMHELLSSIPERAIRLYVDPVRIEQVLNNLVSNAIKYSPRGGPISVSVEQAGEQAIFSVSDRGVGIAPEDLPHIFQPFRRPGASKESIPGVGLGLSVAKRIVEAHRGTIEVESKPGEGTTVRVRLPASAAETLPASAAEKDELQRSSVRHA